MTKVLTQDIYLSSLDGQTVCSLQLDNLCLALKLNLRCLGGILQ